MKTVKNTLPILTIPLDVLSDGTRARVLDEYRARLRSCARPLTYAEASFFYEITPDTLRRYIWEGRVQVVREKNTARRATVTHEEMRAFMKHYKPTRTAVYPRAITIQRAA